MFDSPLSASAYEVLQVVPDISDDELRKAYRLRLRQTHPDTGGDAVLFVQVQRAWELVGTAESRLNDADEAGLIRVKTGSLGDVTSMTGNVSRLNGGALTFAVIVNNPTDFAAAKAAIDTFVAGLPKL